MLVLHHRTIHFTNILNELAVSNSYLASGRLTRKGLTFAFARLHALHAFDVTDLVPLLRFCDGGLGLLELARSADGIGGTDTEVGGETGVGDSRDPEGPDEEVENFLRVAITTYQETTR
jgi:hypothetical protein